MTSSINSGSFFLAAGAGFLRCRLGFGLGGWAAGSGFGASGRRFFPAGALGPPVRTGSGLRRLGPPWLPAWFPAWPGSGFGASTAFGFRLGSPRPASGFLLLPALARLGLGKPQPLRVSLLSGLAGFGLCAGLSWACLRPAAGPAGHARALQLGQLLHVPSRVFSRLGDAARWPSVSAFFRRARWLLLPARRMPFRRAARLWLFLPASPGASPLGPTGRRPSARPLAPFVLDPGGVILPLHCGRAGPLSAGAGSRHVGHFLGDRNSSR